MNGSLADCALWVIQPSCKNDVLDNYNGEQGL